MSKIAVETSIRSIRMAQRLFQRLSAAPGGTSKLRESHRPSQKATNGLMKLTFHRVAGIRVARAEDRIAVLGVPSTGRLEGLVVAGVQQSRGRPDLLWECAMLSPTDDAPEMTCMRT
jgi:hypothetical protein